MMRLHHPENSWLGVSEKKESDGRDDEQKTGHLEVWWKRTEGISLTGFELYKTDKDSITRASFGVTDNTKLVIPKLQLVGIDGTNEVPHEHQLNQ